MQPHKFFIIYGWAWITLTINYLLYDNYFIWSIRTGEIFFTSE